MQEHLLRLQLLLHQGGVLVQGSILQLQGCQLCGEVSLLPLQVLQAGLQNQQQQEVHNHKQ